MSVNIPIRVDTKQVKDAKRQLDVLGESLNNTNELGDLTIGAGASAEVKKLAHEVQRLKQISTQGESRGGILNRKQFEDALRLTTQINSRVQDYSKSLARVKQEYKDLNAEQAKMVNAIRGGTASPEDWSKHRRNKSRMQELSEERKDLEKQRQRMMQLGASADNSRGRISNMDEAAEPGSLGNSIKKALGWTLAAAGGFSLMGFLAQSRGKYRQSVGHQTTLAARGINGGSGDAIGVGMNPLEYMALMEQMSQATSSGGRGARSSAMLAAAFSRANGIDSGSVTSMYGSMYQNTGAARGGDAVLAMAVEKGIKKTRMTEALQLVARNTNITAQAMHGAGAGDKAGASIALAMAALNNFDPRTGKGQFYKSSEFMSIAQNGLTGAGSPAGEIMMFKALKGFNGSWDWKKKYQYEQMKEGGFLKNPELFSEIVGNLRGSKQEKAAQLMAFFPKWNLSTASAQSMLDPAALGLLNEAKGTGKSYDQLEKSSNPQHRQLVARLKSQFSGYAGAERMVQDASHEALLLKSGEKLNQAFVKLEKVVTKVADKILDSKAVGRIAGGADAFGNFLDDNSTEKVGKTGASMASSILKGYSKAFGKDSMLTNQARSRLAFWSVLGNIVPSVMSAGKKGVEAAEPLPQEKTATFYEAALVLLSQLVANTSGQRTAAPAPR